jgi:hypothetical protein
MLLIYHLKSLANDLDSSMFVLLTIKHSSLIFIFKRYSTISSELLTCDIPAINDSIISNKELIDKLYSFLHNDAPLNPLLASYFARVMGSLISRKTDLVNLLNLTFIMRLTFFF